MERIPLPRPKRKTAHPYPHKASKNEPLSSAAILDSEYAAVPQSVSVPRNINSSKSLYHWTPTMPTGCASSVSSDEYDFASSGDDVVPRRWASNETNSQVMGNVTGQRGLLLFLLSFDRFLCWMTQSFQCSTRFCSALSLYWSFV
ncbi:protein REVEILLE 3-like isoform X2 [Salvia divinorum]|uniref:Protein REVEILLE 3-like isoform X2 n=1 Tax=Salvia divinorum TaxID=28513 RepID=A0ABD1H310_SALDI